MLSQNKKLRLTSSFALALQICTMVYGFVLPRFFLECFGSAVNGLVSSITQFLGFIALAECGVGAVVQSALYKPLAKKDDHELSRIVISAEHFFRNIAKLLVVYTIVLVIIYPNIVSDKFEFIYTSSLILIISIGSFAQYYFGITYRLLLMSDQFGFVPIVIQIIALTLNFAISIFLMKMGCSVHVVKLASSVVFLLQPFVISFIAHRWYRIDAKCAYDKHAISQKWNGLAQHVAAVVLASSGVVVLTLFSSLENVSVFAIYNMVVQGVRNLTMSVTNGMQAFLGNVYAQGNVTLFRERFESFELRLHFVVTLLFSVTAVLIVPFVDVYTRGITDVNYIVPVFGITLTAAWGMYCIRLPYNIVVLAVGHYKQTQLSAIVEACLNLTIAIVLVLKFGLVGVAVGTLVAMIYRTFYLAWYISHYVINRNLCAFVKCLFVDVVTIITFVWIFQMLFGRLAEIRVSSYMEWFAFAVKVFVLGGGVAGLINAIFYWKRIITKRKK